MNQFREHLLTILFVALLCVTVGCGKQSSPLSSSQSSDKDKSTISEEGTLKPAAPAPKTEITIELINEITQSQKISYEQGSDAPGSFEKFLESNPHFISDRFDRGQVTSGKAVQNVGASVSLTLPQGAAPENDMINRERLAEFVENFKNQTPDSIVILSSGDPIPLWVTCYNYDGGSSFTVQSCYLLMDHLEWQPLYTSQKIEETDCEWIVLDDPMQQHRYTKYGYEPIPLGEAIGERSESDVLKIVDDLRQKQYPQTDHVVPGDPRTIDDIPCFTFELYQTKDGTSTYTGYSFAVAKDLSRYYEIEQVNGRWLLQARPKMPPTAS